MDTNKILRQTKVFFKRRILRRVCRPMWRRVSSWFVGIWQKSKVLTLLMILAAIFIMFFTCIGPIPWFLKSVQWFFFKGTLCAKHGYIVIMFWAMAILALCFCLTQLHKEQFRQKIAIPFQKWIAPEFPMRGIGAAVLFGLFLASIGFMHLPEALKAFGWLYGGRVAAIPYIATISALAVAPVTILVWYWRHLYKKREREHDLLTLATTSLADKDSPSVRITGLYTLKELVEANPAKLIDVMNILCGFLKHRYHEEEERAKIESNPCLFIPGSQLEMPPDIRAELERQKNDSPNLPEIDFGQSPDIREALNLFSEIWQSRFDKEEKYRIAMEFASSDFPQTYRPNLKKINFLKSDLRGLCLRQVNLTNSNLQRAILFEANLQEAKLQKANLQGATLYYANLQKAKLWKADLQGAELWKADLQEAILFQANLQGAKLERANLQGADLSYTNLQGVELWATNLQGAKLKEAKVGGVNFKSAQLHGATDQPAFGFSLAYRVGKTTNISQEMREQTYSEEDIRPTINAIQKIRSETPDSSLKESLDEAIYRLRDGIGKKPNFPDQDDFCHCGKLTLEMAFEILKEWPEKMQRKELKSLKERGFDVPDRL